MQKMIFSEYEIQQVNRIIDEIYKTMSGLDREECQSAGWCSYMEMKNAFLFQYHTESYWETVIAQRRQFEPCLSLEILRFTVSTSINVHPVRFNPFPCES